MNIGLFLGVIVAACLGTIVGIWLVGRVLFGSEDDDRR